jgi:hypothetical protein
VGDWDNQYIPRMMFPLANKYFLKVSERLIKQTGMYTNKMFEEYK